MENQRKRISEGIKILLTIFTTMETITFINAHNEILHGLGERAMRIEVKVPMPKLFGGLGSVYNARLVFVFKKEILN